MSIVSFEIRILKAFQNRKCFSLIRQPFAQLSFDLFTINLKNPNDSKGAGGLEILNVTLAFNN